MLLKHVVKKCRAKHVSNVESELHSASCVILKVRYHSAYRVWQQYVYIHTVHIYQCQFGCGILKMVGSKMQDFCPRINVLKGILLKKILRLMPVRQKLGMVLENKVVQKLKLEKKVFYKKWSPKLIFLNEFFF